MALWRAAEQFDPDRGVQFRTYAKAKIRGYMSNFGKRERKRRENERNAEVAILAGTDDTEDTADAVVERLSDRTLRVVQDAFRGVDRPDLKRILALRISGMSLAEIERETGLSSYKVRARFNTAREIVRAHIEEKGEDVVFPFEIEARVRK